MTLGEFTAGCIGFFIGVLILDVFCLFYHGRNLFRQIGDALGISAAKEITDFDDLLPAAELPVGKPSRTYPGIIAVAGSPEISTTDIPAKSGILFTFEGPTDGGIAIESGVSCQFDQLITDNRRALHILAFGNPPDGYVLHLYNHKEDYFGEVDGSMYVVPVRKDEANK